jgi:hypothetical protein
MATRSPVTAVTRFKREILSGHLQIYRNNLEKRVLDRHDDQSPPDAVWFHLILQVYLLLYCRLLINHRFGLPRPADQLVLCKFAEDSFGIRGRKIKFMVPCDFPGSRVRQSRACVSRICVVSEPLCRVGAEL